MKKSMFDEEILELEKRADDMSCEGYCDETPPYKPCAACRASSALNYIGDIVREALDD